MSKRQITRLQKILIGLALLIISLGIDLLTDFHAVINALIYLFPVLLLGFDMFITAFFKVLKADIFNEYVISAVCCMLAFFTGFYSEAGAVMLFLQIRELIKGYNITKARNSISAVSDITCVSANLKGEAGIIPTEIKNIKIGDIITVFPGERIPLDGEIVLGNTEIDTFPINGKREFTTAVIGDNVYSGSTNKFSEIEIKVTKTADNSTAYKIKQTIDTAIDNKTKPQAIVDKYSKLFFFAVLVTAVVTTVFSNLLGIPLGESLHRGTTVLALSALCHIALTVPLSIYAGVHYAVDNGVLVKSSEVLENAAKSDTVIFDKTGTLTSGEFKISKIVPNGIPAYKLLELAASAEYYSNHPIAKTLRKECENIIDKSKIREVNEISGCGVVTKIGERQVAVGNRKLMKQLNLHVIDFNGTAIHVAVDNDYLGYILVEDELKYDCEKSIENLKKLNVKNISMFTGDNEDTAKTISEQIGIDEYFCEMTTNSKVEKLKDLKFRRKKTCFVGDGINDVPVLKEADIGIVMGCLQSERACENADAIIIGEKLSAISSLILAGRKTLFSLNAGLILSGAVKLICLLLAVLGFMNLWIVAIAETLILILGAVIAVMPFKKR